MKKILLNAVLAFLAVLNVYAVDVSITMNSVSRTMTLAAKGSGNPVDVGTPTASYVYTFEAEAGDYIMTGYNSTGVATGTMEISIFEDGEMLDGGGQYGKNFRITTITAGASNAGWTLGTDYEMECFAMSREDDIRVITTADNVTDNRKVFMMQIGDSYRLMFDMKQNRINEGFVPTFNHANVVTANNATATTAIPLKATYTITIPEEANLYVGGKWGAMSVQSGGTHYTRFIDQYPVDSLKEGGKKTYTYALARNGQYNFKVRQPGKLTHAGKFMIANAEIGGSFEITVEELGSESPKYINADPSANTQANESDIFMNINAQGHLNMKSGQTHLLLNLRRWQLTDNSTNNYFIEPDFHYTIVDLDGNPCDKVIEIDEDQFIRTKGPGTAIVKITYDAINVRQRSNAGVWSSYFYGSLWSAILPENTGTFVVTVDQPEDPALKRNMGIQSEYSSNTFIDAEHDVFYYLEGEEGFIYTFTPEGAISVSIANPTLETNISKYNGFRNVTANEDGSYSVLLTRGRNIVKITSASGASLYQILNAKPYTFEIMNISSPNEPIKPGDQMRVQFSGLYHPANKLAGLYNMSAYVTYNGIPNGTSLILSPNQYQFCGTPSAQAINLTVPKDWDVTEPMVLKDGVIQVNGFGSNIGRHRSISPVAGTNPNFTAVVRVSYFGSIPDVTIPVAAPKAYYRVKFEGLPENSVLTVLDKDKDTVRVASAGSYEYDLFILGSYSYTAFCEGYQLLRGEVFEISDESPEEQTITLTMIPLADSDWDGATITEPVQVTAEESNTEGGQFEGLEGFYKITSGANLAWLANETNAGRFSHNAVMTNNIGLSNFDWTRIGSTMANSYRGTFDGGGYTIEGLYMNVTSTYQGLFGYINAATIKNLTVEGTVKSSTNIVAAIVGYTQGASIIENCHNKATVSSGGQNVGGILGQGANAATQIISCSNSGDITGTNNVGGIVGSSSATQIINAYNQGNIRGTTSGVGGISGNMAAAGAITNAYNTGNITTTSETYAGGAIRGTVTVGTLTNTYAYAGDYDLTDVTVKTSEEFELGEVTWLLGSSFGQTIGTDDLPLFTEATVYQVIYTNNLDDETDTLYTNTTLPSSIKEGYTASWFTSLDGEPISEISSDSDLYALFTIPVASANLNEQSIILEEEENYQLIATVLPENAENKNISWESSDDSVATVDENGLVTAIATGTATITVTTEDNEFTATCEVTVTEKTIAVSSVSLNENEITLDKEETYQLIATVLPENASNKNVSWESSDDSVAIVDENGLVTAIAAGAATITVTTIDGEFTAICIVTVNGVSINDITVETTFSVYPNPFVEYIVVDITESGTATIYDLSGTVILNTNLINGSNRINTSALSKGAYLLKIGKNVVKIIK